MRIAIGIPLSMGKIMNEDIFYDYYNIHIEIWVEMADYAPGVMI
jgi:hypothetical protein